MGPCRPPGRGRVGRSAIQVARGTSRATRRLRDDAVDLLIATPETALALQRRAALHADALAAVLLAWPEAWEDEEAVGPLMQDLKEAQRIVLTSAPERAAALVERYARRALTLGAAALHGEPVGPVRTVTCHGAAASPPSRDLVELLDPTSLVIWTADRGPTTRSPPPSALDERDATRGDRRRAGGQAPHRLRSARRARGCAQLVGAGELVLLVPPGAEGYLERLATPRRPLRLPGALEAATTAAAARRAAIVRALETGTPDRALLTLAPLFERHDPAAVAAALYELWTSAAGATAPAALPDIPATARIYVGVGKKDGATVNDLVAVLTKEVRLERTKIGRVELRDAFSLVELAGPGCRAGRHRAQRDDHPAAAGDGPGGPRRAIARRPSPRPASAAPREPTAGEALALPVDQLLQNPAGAKRRHHSTP